MLAAQSPPLTDARHPEQSVGPVIGLYVWQYPLRLFHWGLVISIGVLAFTGYYIHDPFIVGQIQHPFLMGECQGEERHGDSRRDLQHRSQGEAQGG